MKKWLLSGLLACGMTFGFAAQAMADIVVGIVDMKGAVEKTMACSRSSKMKRRRARPSSKRARRS